MAQMPQLRDYLSSTPAGTIADVGELASLLAKCWDEFDGAHTEGMEADKLDRMEEVSWDPPVLSFTIERHGRTVMGSSLAELQCWDVNVETRSATCGMRGYRQVRRRQAALDVKPMAEEIVALILNGREDRRLKKNADGSVRVLIGKIIPDGSAVQQTLRGRRRRFRVEVEGLLTNRGWYKVEKKVWSTLQRPANRRLKLTGAAGRAEGLRPTLSRRGGGAERRSGEAERTATRFEGMAPGNDWTPFRRNWADRFRSRSNAC